MNRRRFLAVDDEPINLNMMRTILEAEGHEVVTLANGLAALKLCREGDTAFDIILMDVQMPTLNGLETALCLRQIAGMADVPIIFVSARASAADQEAGRAAGGKHYLVKPYRRQDLLRAIDLVAGGGQPPPGSAPPHEEIA